MMRRTAAALCALMLALPAPLHAQPQTAATRTAVQPQGATQAPAAVEAGSQRLFIASDSTAQTYDASRYPQAGWGQFLACGLSADATVINRAIGGRSTRTFISEGRWDRLMADVQPGDTVLIQFGHNDSTRYRPERFADATTSFRDNLLRFVWQLRGARAVPVLLTPVARRSFDADGKAKADYAEYSAVTREVAQLSGSPLIDLEALSRALVDRTGAEAARAFYLHYPAGSFPAFPQGIADETHFSEIGARRIAGLIVDALAGLDIPAARLALPVHPDLERGTLLGSTACH